MDTPDAARPGRESAERAARPRAESASTVLEAVPPVDLDHAMPEQRVGGVTLGIAGNGGAKAIAVVPSSPVGAGGRAA